MFPHNIKGQYVILTDFGRNKSKSWLDRIKEKAYY
jgi:hypothetical protein